MNVLVVGCGPAGLIAAEAADQFGAQVHIVSRKEKSTMPGAQYLHEPIPGVTPEKPDGHIDVIKRGTRRGYARKVYGNPEAPVSWDHYGDGLVPAWRLSATYDALWFKWEDTVLDELVGGNVIRHVATRHDLVFCTIPRPALCRASKGHVFPCQRVWIRDSVAPNTNVVDNTIIYSGDPMDAWYRTSRLFEHDSTEFSHWVPDAREGFKPMWTDCDCQPDNVIPVGRFGKWNKKVLTHHVYKEVQDALLAVQ